MKRLSIRTRITLAFAAASAVVLVALGTFLYLRFESQLTETIDESLAARADQVLAAIGEPGSGLGGSGTSSLTDLEDAFAQVLTPGGEIFDSTPQLGDTVVLSAADLATVRDHVIVRESEGLPGIDGTARLLASTVEAGGRELIVVAGASLSDREEALGDLLSELAIGGPLALALATLFGWAVAGSALRPLEEGYERERRFVGDASHELRTPLALHKTELEVALRYEEDPEALRGAITSAIAEVDRLIRLAEDLLVVARSSDREGSLTREPIEAGSLIAAVAERFGARFEEAGRPLAVDVDGDGLRLEGDRLRLERAVTNLIENALQHGDGPVRIGARRNGAMIEIAVTDGGRGIPEELIGSAFERFTRADHARPRGGTGLGLAIVDAVARAHGGTVGAANTADGGARVWMRLPAALNVPGHTP